MSRLIRDLGSVKELKRAARRNAIDRPAGLCVFDDVSVLRREAGVC